VRTDHEARGLGGSRDQVQDQSETFSGQAEEKQGGKESGGGGGGGRGGLRPAGDRGAGETRSSKVPLKEDYKRKDSFLRDG